MSHFARVLAVGEISLIYKCVRQLLLYHIINLNVLSFLLFAPQQKTEKEVSRYMWPEH